MTITSNFPGGNANIKKLADKHFSIEPDLRDTRTPWFYWCFKLPITANENYIFEIKEGCMTSKGYAYSLDQGLTWHWAEANTIKNNAIHFSTQKSNEIIFCISMGYTLKNWDHFLTTISLECSPKIETLCKTTQGRNVPLLRIKKKEFAKYKIIFTARHHSCEVMANYLLEGALNELLSKSTSLETTDFEFVFIPFIDLDGAENGDQGKNRTPHDHNRDYTSTPIYPETLSVMQEINQNKNATTITLDVHCPHLRGKFNESIYFVGAEPNKIFQEQCNLLKIIETNNNSPLPFSSKSILPFGEGWNKTPTDGIGNATWCSRQPHNKKAASLEISYANAEGKEVNQNTARQLGAIIAKSIIQYCKQI